MARRRESVKGTLGVMPEGLEEMRASSCPFDGSEVERAEWRAARSARRAARAAYLATVMVRPARVGINEFLYAHGLTYMDRNTVAKIGHLTL